MTLYVHYKSGVHKAMEAVDAKNPSAGKLWWADHTGTTFESLYKHATTTVLQVNVELLNHTMGMLEKVLDLVGTVSLCWAKALESSGY